MDMKLNLRQAIMQRVAGKDTDELLDIVEGSIGQDEKALPGLGVLFEIIWQHSDENTQDHLIAILKGHV